MNFVIDLLYFCISSPTLNRMTSFVCGYKWLQLVHAYSNDTTASQQRADVVQQTPISAV